MRLDTLPSIWHPVPTRTSDSTQPDMKLYLLLLFFLSVTCALDEDDGHSQHVVFDTDDLEADENQVTRFLESPFERIRAAIGGDWGALNEIYPPKVQDGREEVDAFERYNQQVLDSERRLELAQ